MTSRHVPRVGRKGSAPLPAADLRALQDAVGNLGGIFPAAQALGMGESTIAELASGGFAMASTLERARERLADLAAGKRPARGRA